MKAVLSLHPKDRESVLLLASQWARKFSLIVDCSDWQKCKLITAFFMTLLRFSYTPETWYRPKWTNGLRKIASSGECTYGRSWWIFISSPPERLSNPLIEIAEIENLDVIGPNWCWVIYERAGFIFHKINISFRRCQFDIKICNDSGMENHDVTISAIVVKQKFLFWKILICKF